MLDAVIIGAGTNGLTAATRLAGVPWNTEQTGEWRSISVRVKNRDKLVVRTRQGYYAFPEQPAM